MRCTVLPFAHLIDALGSEPIDLDLPDGSTVADVLQHLAKLHPAIRTLKGRLAVAINERYATPATPIPDGSTLALIPPVSGG